MQPKHWTAISGTWKLTNVDVESDVRKKVRDILDAGNGIVTGGALGVDYYATDEALKYDPHGSRVKVIIPTKLDVYCDHFMNRASEKVISFDEARKLTAQLRQLASANPENVVQLNHDTCTQATYLDRNTSIVNAADALVAFQVNGSMGTQDTIDKAIKKGIPVEHYTYDIALQAQKVIS
jgi:hypothetical protein